MIKQKTSTVEVFVTESFGDGGTAYYKGHIYEVYDHEAERFIEQGNAVLADVDGLDRFKKSFETLKKSMERDIKQKQDDTRLTDEAKAEDIEGIKLSYQIEADSLQEMYEEKIMKLIDEKSTYINQGAGTDVNAYEVEMQAGVLMTDILMQPTLEDALDVFNSESRYIDNHTARHLLANFITIKHELESKVEGEAHIVARQNNDISDVYKTLKEKALSTEQQQAKQELQILHAIKKRGINFLI